MPLDIWFRERRMDWNDGQQTGEGNKGAPVSKNDIDEGTDLFFRSIKTLLVFITQLHNMASV
jgi:hypothetical protein